MVTEAPGPKVAGPHGGVRQVRVVHARRRRLPRHPLGRQGRHRQGRRRQHVHRHGGRGRRERRRPQPPQGARRHPAPVRRHHAHHGHHEPQAHRARQEGLGDHARGPRRQLPHGRLPGRQRRRRDGHQVRPRLHRPLAAHRLPRRLPRRLVRHRRHDHRLQLPSRLGPAHRRRPAPPVRVLLPLPVRQGVPQPATCSAASTSTTSSTAPTRAPTTSPPSSSSPSRARAATWRRRPSSSR